MFSVTTPQISKKWILEENRLRETSKLSISVDCSKLNENEPDPFKALSWSSSLIEFNKILDDRNFLFDFNQDLLRCNGESSSRKAKYEILSKDHIRIIFEGAPIHIILFPSPTFPKSELKTTNVRHKEREAYVAK